MSTLNIKRNNNPFGLTVKRFFDFVASLLGFILLLPIMGIIALSICLQMPGPIFFKQTRIGLYGKPFTLYKFRTMQTGHAGSTVSVKGDNRITPLGHTLRKWKLDELPELWNILKGDMSLVGPRPDVPGYADQLSEEDKIILSVRPGLTGLATLKYIREEELLAAQNEPEWYNDHFIFPDKVRLNKKYVNQRSMLLDLKIIYCTLLRKPFSFLAL